MSDRKVKWAKKSEMSEGKWYFLLLILNKSRDEKGEFQRNTFTLLKTPKCDFSPGTIVECRTMRYLLLVH